MFSLKLYMRNSLGGSPVEYTIQNLYPQDLYIGRRRDVKNLLVIRKFIEGGIILKNPDDFDAVADYIFSPQDGIFYIDGDSNQCLVKFSYPNYTTKQLRISIDLLDDYSKLLDGARWNSWNGDQQPAMTKEYTYTELDGALPADFDEHFADGSQYMYDTEVSGSELWGTEVEIFTVSKDVYVSDTLLFNIGGDGEGGSELTIAQLIPKLEYLDQYYKPTYIKWSNSTGSPAYFQTVLIHYEREFRYFAEEEIPPDGWEPVNGTRTKNGFTYNKYVRPLYGDQTYLSGNDIYFIRDGGGSYTLAEFRGINTELQKSEKFYQLNDLLYRFFDIITFPGTYNSIIADDLYICILRNYNGGWGTEKFILEPFINTLRDQFRIYFELDGRNVDFKYLDFNTKLLDLDDYRSYDFIPNIQIGLSDSAREYNISTSGWQLDFKNQIITFYGKSNIKESLSYAITTDLENTSKNEGFILMKTKEDFHDQIYEKWSVVGANNGLEALHITPDGKFIWWDAAELDLATYLQFEIYSNTLYLDIDDEIQISYSVSIYTGSIIVKVGNYNVTHTASTTVSASTTLAGSRTENARISIPPNANFRGLISNFQIKIKSLVPETTTGVISDRSLKNGSLSAANTIVNNKPLMSYPQGHLVNYGTLDCNTRYNKELESKIALDYDIFDYDMNHYIELDSEKYIIFEEKRQILDEDTASEITQIKAKSNEIY